MNFLVILNLDFSKNGSIFLDCACVRYGVVRRTKSTLFLSHSRSYGVIPVLSWRCFAQKQHRILYSMLQRLASIRLSVSEVIIRCIYFAKSNAYCRALLTREMSLTQMPTRVTLLCSDGTRDVECYVDIMWSNSVAMLSNTPAYVEYMLDLALLALQGNDQ